MKKATVRGLAIGLGIVTMLGAGVGAFAAGSAIAKKNAEEVAMATASIMEQEKKELTAAADAKQSEIEKQAEEAIKKAEVEKAKAEAEAKAAKEAAEKAKADQKAAEEANKRAQEEANKRAQEEARRRAQEQKEQEKKDVYTVEPMSKDMTTTVDGLKLRQWATTNSDILTVLNNGDIVKVLGAVKCNGQYTGWYKVDRDGIVGYCCGDWLTDIKEAAETPYTVFDTTYYLALRNAPATNDANEIGQLHNGDTFYVTDRSNGSFYYGHTADGQWGYVNANYIAI